MARASANAAARAELRQDMSAGATPRFASVETVSLARLEGGQTNPCVVGSLSIECRAMRSEIERELRRGVLHQVRRSDSEFVRDFGEYFARALLQPPNIG